MKKGRRSTLIILTLLVLACQNEKKDKKEKHSIDEMEISKATKLADKAIEAVGGFEAYKSIRYLAWDFFGERHLLWDKWEGRVRIESYEDSTIYQVNINDKIGRIQRNGIEIVEDSLKNELVAEGVSIWINDSYWLVLPFKLKDKGVILEHLGEQKLQNGATSDAVQMTYSVGTGETPQNKYVVHFDSVDGLLKQWDYYRNATDLEPRAIWPWDNYQKHGTILLSSDRSDNSGPHKVQVFDELPDGYFTSFDTLDLKNQNAL